MSLLAFYDKTVRIHSCDGKVFFGVISDYFYPDDNDDNVESIILETKSGELYEFKQSDIQEIRVIWTVQLGKYIFWQTINNNDYNKAQKLT